MSQELKRELQLRIGKTIDRCAEELIEGYADPHALITYRMGMVAGLRLALQALDDAMKHQE